MDSNSQEWNHYRAMNYCKDGFRNEQNNWQGMSPGWGQAVPYYMAYAYPIFLQGEDEDERDLERMKSRYSKTAFMVQTMVEDECDRMEYDGSLMFDEYPDKRMVDDLVEDIYQRMQNSGWDEEMDEEESDSVFATQCKGCNGNRFGDGLQDLITVMLFQEMHRRRCRRRRCKRWW